MSQVPGFLLQFQPVRLKHSVGRPARSSMSPERPTLTWESGYARPPEPCPSSDAENQQSRAARNKRASQLLGYPRIDHKCRHLTFFRKNSMRVRLVPRQLLTEDEATLLIIRHSSASTANFTTLPHFLARQDWNEFFGAKFFEEIRGRGGGGVIQRLVQKQTKPFFKLWLSLIPEVTYNLIINLSIHSQHVYM